MKKAVIWMIAGMMLLGSLKVFAEEGGDIERELARGKVEATEFENNIEAIRSKIGVLYSLQEDLSAVENTHGVLTAIGRTADEAESRLAEVQERTDTDMARKLSAELDSTIVELRKQTEKELSH